ncbi:MAG: IS1595 family transposase [Luteimonas sp.]|nr:IS1595 family transposase [Luteimonas sp.]
MGLNRCKLSKKVQSRLIEFFVLEVTARSAADVVGIQPNTAALFYRKLRQRIADQLALVEHEVFDGAVDLDESYFGGVRKGKRGRGAAGKVVVFGLLKRGGKMYAKVVDNAKAAKLMPVIQRKLAPDSWVYTDSFRNYDALDVSQFHHVRINHSVEFARGRNHINGIENFWIQAKRVLRKYNAIPRDSFPLFLKECEFRFWLEAYRALPAINSPNPVP